MRLSRTLVALVAATLLSAPAAQAAFDPAYEASNFSKIEERFRYVVGTPDFQAVLRAKSLLRETQAAQIQVNDPDRLFYGQLCWQKMDGCAGEVRAYDFVTKGAGLATPVSWVARNGSVISGHVWATADGPARRPGIVLTTGSVQAPEELYWFEAQALAKAGYVVLTWDVQGQGYSDTMGEGADAMDGVPSQTGEPFYDGTEDALDFFLSDAAHPFSPRTSCSSGTDHGAKQRARVQSGKASAFDPLAPVLDVSRIGIFGHSLGAGAVSYIGQLDPRVRAIVAYDNLGAQATDATAPPATCTSGSSPRPAKLALTKPSLGISNDYGLTPQPNTSEPDPAAKTVASKRLTAAGTDSMQLVVRGGTHYESSNIPNPAFGATYRGNDFETFYTVAWFDRYVKGDASAEKRILTDRWRNDTLEAGVDPDKDGNILSRYYRSRVDLHTAAGDHVLCEDLRTGCAALGPDGTGTAPYDAAALTQAPATARSGPAKDALDGVCATSTTDPVGADGAPAAATLQSPPCARQGAGVLSAPSTGDPAVGCVDRTAPVSSYTSVKLTRKAIRLRGRSGDAGCSGASGRLVGVSVAVGREVGKRCRFLQPDGAFGATVSCARTPYLQAKGTASWSFSRTLRLPKGRYKVYVRGTDATGNVERKAARVFRKVRVA